MGVGVVQENRLALQPARSAACLSGLARCAFVAEATDTLVAGAAGDRDFYEHREQILPENQVHTQVFP